MEDDETGAERAVDGAPTVAVDLEQCQDTQLHNAACVGDIEALRTLLQEERFQRRINEKTVWSSDCLPTSPLHIAATLGHADCVALLIDFGAEKDLLDLRLQSPLLGATENGHLNCVQVLLKAGANPNGNPDNCYSPVYHATGVGRADILQELIRYGAEVDGDLQKAFGYTSSTLDMPLKATPLYTSAAQHTLSCFRLLLQAGANPDYNSWDPVCEAKLIRSSPICLLEEVLRDGCGKEFVQLLIDFGADLSLLHSEPISEEDSSKKLDPEALQVFREAKCLPRTLSSLCRIAVRRAIGKRRLSSISSLPVPDRIIRFLLYEQ
ncbi:ankyrin repeat and SOCS box protein 1-like [Bufo gargarizans]|uniref:ankyrin repeat and SOCS box protein 1-like n=1 Tax=Bufo gargarizans TaxID=30331 RepID=UPI001CF57AFA|nr:ankyrin repeat and SOCS box protein 1-like [Bufo gargarizans]